MFNLTQTLIPAFIEQPLPLLWAHISSFYLADEETLLRQLLPLAMPHEQELAAMTRDAGALIAAVRADKKAVPFIDALLKEYRLGSREGILLMSLTEALLRIPDATTADALIRDKLRAADWEAHRNKSDVWLVNAATRGLMLLSHMVRYNFSKPVIRHVLYQAMKIMGHQFVFGQHMPEALRNSKKQAAPGYRYSFDLLGESSLTMRDARDYVNSYMRAIALIGTAPQFTGLTSHQRPTMSIKLSAMHPRYDMANRQRVLTEMHDMLLALLKQARQYEVGVTIDAEEMDRLELSLELFEKLYRNPVVRGWGLLGIVVQTYSRRALPVMVWLAALAKAVGDVIPVRIVKGAYWDSEIKLSQQRGLATYPVFTRKEATDVSYLACARFVFAPHINGLLYPQFASHNAQTVAAITAMATHSDYEFQRLHGMGDALYYQLLKRPGVGVRIYAPVGSHRELLPYLVRRLLENGANSSFVHKLTDAQIPVASLTVHPASMLQSYQTLYNPQLPLPPSLFPQRKNSGGFSLNIKTQWGHLQTIISPFQDLSWQAGSIINGATETGAAQRVTSPFDRQRVVGQVVFATDEQVTRALTIAQQSLHSWQTTSVSQRAQCLQRLADLLEQHQGELITLCQREAGKTLPDSIDEIREAVDFCRYYAVEALSMFTGPRTEQRPDGSVTTLQRQGVGVFVCISPWNFPLAIFLGQITAALVAGNTVIAKPAEQTSLIAYRATELMREAGVPAGVIQLLLGEGGTIGRVLLSDIRVAGVAFTGSTATAHAINRTLAARDAAVATLIAETGGQNVMLVDSTALLEQVVRDVMRSAFASAGQRCSALRVLFIQQEVAEPFLTLLQGAMAELTVGNPCLLATDVGPVIDNKARIKLERHLSWLQQHGRFIAQAPATEQTTNGDFILPTAYEIEHLAELTEEHFGPVLHVIRYAARDLDSVLDDINHSGFGLTLGIHSRNESMYRAIERKLRVGNCYINRDQIGAVVGAQPFGGRGLSGTGPKAGGPHYLYRFSCDRETEERSKPQCAISQRG